MENPQVLAAGDHSCHSGGAQNPSHILHMPGSHPPELAPLSCPLPRVPNLHTARPELRFSFFPKDAKVFILIKKPARHFLYKKKKKKPGSQNALLSPVFTAIQYLSQSLCTLL
jgi:hypothetical protein